MFQYGISIVAFVVSGEKRFINKEAKRRGWVYIKSVRFLTGSSHQWWKKGQNKQWRGRQKRRVKRYKCFTTRECVSNTRTERTLPLLLAYIVPNPLERTHLGKRDTLVIYSLYSMTFSSEEINSSDENCPIDLFKSSRKRSYSQSLL